MRLFRAAALLAALIILAAQLVLPAASFALDATTGNSVTLPWGNWSAYLVDFVLQLVLVLLGPVLLWATSFLPATLKAYITAQKISQVEQLLAKAVVFGFNNARGAVVGKALSVDVGSQVVASAAQYAVDHGPSKLIDWLGGPEEIKAMILARIHLEENATAGQVLRSLPPITGLDDVLGIGS